ncbi:MAG: hypothetical protein KDN20_06320 [Verrucomicrobiae bacterium]|nr:hypothetical protein [Verrucomicrobiae bacterium]
MFAHKNRQFRSTASQSLLVLVALSLLLAGFSACRKGGGKPAPDPRYRLDRFSGVTVADQRHAFQMIVHRYWNSPMKGESVPDEILTDAVSGAEIHLHELIKDKPLVLIMGSNSCSHLQMEVSGIRTLIEQYGNRAEFQFVYLREAHPEGGFSPNLEREGIAQEKLMAVDSATLEERREAARILKQSVGEGLRVSVDSMDDRWAARWGAWPSRVFVVSVDKRIAYCGGPGPWYANILEDSWHEAPPAELESIFRKMPFDEFSLEEYLRTLPSPGNQKP